jgi:hypothetical protein
LLSSRRQIAVRRKLAPRSLMALCLLFIIFLFSVWTGKIAGRLARVKWNRTGGGWGEAAETALKRCGVFAKGSARFARCSHCQIVSEPHMLVVIEE